MVWVFFFFYFPFFFSPFFLLADFSWFQKALASYHGEEELESQLLCFALHVKFPGLIVQVSFTKAPLLFPITDRKRKCIQIIFCKYNN